MIAFTVCDTPERVKKRPTGKYAALVDAVRELPTGKSISFLLSALEKEFPKVLDARGSLYAACRKAGTRVSVVTQDGKVYISRKE